jgi:hypothetical protein
MLLLQLLLLEQQAHDAATVLSVLALRANNNSHNSPQAQQGQEHPIGVQPNGGRRASRSGVEGEDARESEGEKVKTKEGEGEVHGHTRCSYVDTGYCCS